MVFNDGIHYSSSGVLTTNAVGTLSVFGTILNKEEALSLYKVYLVSLQGDYETIERNIVAKNQVNAQVKAFSAEEIENPDLWHCHVVHVCGLPEIDK